MLPRVHVPGIFSSGGGAPVHGTSANDAGHIRPLHVNRGAARVDIGRAYIFIMMVISKIMIHCESHVLLMW